MKIVLIQRLLSWGILSFLPIQMNFPNIKKIWGGDVCVCVLGGGGGGGGVEVTLAFFRILCKSVTLSNPSVKIFSSLLKEKGFCC